MLKNLFILSILSFSVLSAKDNDESVIIGHYSIKEVITPGALRCDEQELDCTTKLACKDCN